MIFGTTAYLLGFFTVIVPVAIHLWSKKTRTTVPFGTIRFLREDDTRAVKSLIPTEWPLLLLRVILLVLLVLLMSEPLWKKEAANRDVILIDPAYRNHPDLTNLIDTYQDAKAIRWFSSGFPEITDSILTPSSSSWELLGQLIGNSENITIFSPRRMAEFRGSRPEAAAVTWATLPMERKLKELGTFETNTGNVKIESSSGVGFTQFDQKEAGGALPQKLVVTVNLETDQAYQPLADFITASIDAINQDSPLQIQIVEEDKADWQIWLREGEKPSQRKVLFASNRPDRQKIKEVAKDIYAIASFDVEDFLSYNFPIRLEQILGAGMVDMAYHDWRELPEHQLPTSDLKADVLPAEIAEPIRHWFWGLLIMVLLLERFLSLKTSEQE